jgi:hypothetical protein
MCHIFRWAGSTLPDREIIWLAPEHVRSGGTLVGFKVCWCISSRLCKRDLASVRMRDSDYWAIMALSTGYGVLRAYTEGGWSQAIERVVGTFVFGLWSGVRGCMALTFTVS